MRTAIFGLTFLSFFMACTATEAADGAQSRALGFSPDAKFFAFEQYGSQDGSGFPYSDVYVLDIDSDKWVTGTPVRALIESETSTIEDARAKSFAVANPIIAKHQVTAAYDTLVHMPHTEVIATRNTVRFARYYNSMGNFGNYDAITTFELDVKEVAVATVPECPDADIIKIVGMELTLKNTMTGATKTLAKDVSIPKSRYCPSGYDLEAVFAPSRTGLAKDPMVALIGVYSRGFEGADRRFIAVPFELIE